MTATSPSHDSLPSGPLPGTVYLVGAGPGDPELLTLRAARLLAEADVVVYDYLVSPAVLDLVPPVAQKVFVGKRRGHHTLPQEALNQLLVDLAHRHRHVVRLKGGDPYMFGRGGEEVETLQSQGIPFEVIPGITAAAGIGAYSGIPLTHRDYAHACIFVTGHLRDGSMNLDWPALTRRGQTVVIYMGLVGLPVLCEQLIRHGLPADWPAAIIESGTCPSQRTVIGNLTTLAELASHAGLKAPTLIIVGEVVRLHDRLAWFAEQSRCADQSSA